MTLYGTQAEMERLERYMRQVHKYTLAQERDIDSMWGIFEAQKRK